MRNGQSAKCPPAAQNAESFRIWPRTGGYYGIGFPYITPGDIRKNSAHLMLGGFSKYVPRPTQTKMAKKNMSNAKTIASVIAVIGLITAVIVLITEGLKLYRELPANVTPLSTQIIPVTQVIQVTEVAKPADVTSTASTQTTITSTPTFLAPTETITVSSKDGDGFSWHALVTGNYSIKYESGAYSPWPDDTGCDKAGCWKTTVFVYKNCATQWIRKENATLDEPGNFDWRIGEDPWQQTPEQAEEMAKLTDGITIELQSGDCLKFIAIDGTDQTTGYSAYTDNRNFNDGVIITIGLMSP